MYRLPDPLQSLCDTAFGVHLLKARAYHKHLSMREFAVMFAWDYRA